MTHLYCKTDRTTLLRDGRNSKHAPPVEDRSQWTYRNVYFCILTGKLSHGLVTPMHSLTHFDFLI